MTQSPTILHRSHAAAVTLVLVVAAPGMGFAQTSGTIINGGLNVTGGLVSDTVKATSVVIGGTTFGGGGSTNLTGGVTVTGGLTADTANVTGLFTAGPASVTTLNASGPATLSGGAAVSGGLTASTAAVTGATTLSGGLNVAKGLVSDTANITGNATIGGNLTIGSLTYANGYSLASGPNTQLSIGSTTGGSTNILGSTVSVASNTNGTFIAGTNSNGVGVTIQGTGTGGADVVLQSSNAQSTLSLDGSAANMHGSNSIQLSGGNTSLTLNNNGARFGGANGEPVRLSGIANGIRTNDAVNRGQLDLAYRGIAGAMAIASLPAPPPGARYSLGFGLGTFAGQTSAAVGLKANIRPDLHATAGLTYLDKGEMAASAGVGYSW